MEVMVGRCNSLVAQAQDLLVVTKVETSILMEELLMVMDLEVLLR